MERDAQVAHARRASGSRTRCWTFMPPTSTLVSVPS